MLLRPVLPRSICACLLLSASAGGHATLTGFTEQASFEAATTGMLAALTNFEPLTVAELVTGGAGFSLAVLAAGELPVVSTGFWTTSGVNYLGLNNADGQFLNGDLLTFTFASPVTAFGLYVVGGSDLANPAFSDVGVQMTSGVFSISTSKTPEKTDGQGSYAFFIGIVDTGRTLSSVTLSGFSPGLMEYAVDDVQVSSTVPEPAMELLLSAGLLGLAALRRCRPSKALSSTLKVTTKGEFL